MLDCWGRDIHYLRISVTDRCNLRCRYCMPAGGVSLKRHEQILSYENIAKVAEAAANLGVWKIRLTGGEPLVRRGVVDLVKRLREIQGIREISMTTNGVLLHRYANDLKAAGLDRLNISIDSLDPERYHWLTRIGNLDEALRGVEAAREAGFRNTKINMVLMEETTGYEVEQLAEFCRQRDMRLQRIHYYRLEDHHTIPPGHEAERPLPCNSCNRIRMTADGYLKPCLFSDTRIPLDWNSLETSILRAIKEKPASGTACRSMENWQIGG